MNLASTANPSPGSRRKIFFRLCLLATAIALGLVIYFDARHRSPTSEANPIAQIEWPVMGTVARLEEKPDAASQLEELRPLVQSTYEHLEQLLSAWNPQSELSRLAAARCTNWTESASTEVRPCYAAALRLMEQSACAFNPYLGARLRELGMGRKGVYSDFDLGAIAKGFAVDVAAQKISARLKSTSSSSEPNLLLDLGGNLKVMGTVPWRTGIRNPFHAKTPSSSPFCAVIALTNGESVATSGNYERFAIKNGKRVSHILDGRTGEPVAGIASVTVITPSSYGAMLADGLSTTLFVLGIDEGTNFLRRHYPLARAIWILDCPERPEIVVPHADLVQRLTDVRFPIRQQP